MKKKLLFFLLTTTLLSACSALNKESNSQLSPVDSSSSKENNNSSSNDMDKTTTSSSSEESTVATGAEIFADFITAYENDTFPSESEYPEPRIRYSEYAFYDINNDGIEEILIGSLQTDGSVYLATFLHKDEDFQKSGEESDLRLFQLYSYQGTYRGSYNLFDDGAILFTTWSPGTGYGTATTYYLANGSTDILKEQEIDVRIPGDDPVALSGLDASRTVDLSNLDWYAFHLKE
ncbi:hypothetical protein K6V33_07755 [Streptococcus suis]|nr:hypothetical protein [Streptococcus suis]HEL1640063.1 hypothetical protein [Streptococcus suis]HEL9644485.1 hypothetical protein [Streptococcus suis]